jgi:hypothetical protein
MFCRPGKIMNPLTGKCIDAGGHIAHNLAQKGYIADYEARPYESRRVTRRKRMPHVTLVEPVICAPGFVKSPETGRCIKIGGTTYKRLFPPAPAPAPAPVPASPAPASRKAANLHPTSEHIKLPVGSAGIAPLVGEHVWTLSNCKNTHDPITGLPFASAGPATLQDLIRLHNRTCVLAPALHDKVAAEHKVGQVATIPGDPTNHMTLDDFKALRDSIRRRNPGYRIPARKHQPPPPNWQLYVSPDNRSGPDFASVMYVDTTKIVESPEGIQYPLDSVKVDMGFIPLKIEGALCTPQLVGDLLARLANENRLLTPIAGGWKPVGGFPFTKKYWSVDIKMRFGKLCTELTKALMSPM